MCSHSIPKVTLRLLRERTTAISSSISQGDIVLYLTGNLSPLNTGANISNAGGFATESSGLLQIALELYGDIDPPMVIHELTHAADYRFLGEGLFSAEDFGAGKCVLTLSRRFLYGS